jgi:hypothetical protein
VELAFDFTGHRVLSDEMNESTRRDWRSLGFYYDRDDELKQWRIQGTQEGLCGFARRIREYSSDPRNAQLSEHMHFGPYAYLEVGTWSSPEITEHWIAGPIQALAALAAKIEDLVRKADAGVILNFRSQFSPSSTYELTLEVQAEGFDPALADPECQ